MKRQGGKWKIVALGQARPLTYSDRVTQVAARGIFILDASRLIEGLVANHVFPAEPFWTPHWSPGGWPDLVSTNTDGAVSDIVIGSGEIAL